MVKILSVICDFFSGSLPHFMFINLIDRLWSAACVLFLPHCFDLLEILIGCLGLTQQA